MLELKLGSMAEALEKIKDVPGVLCFKHRPTGKYLYMVPTNLKRKLRESYLSLIKRTFHNPPLNEITENVDEIEVSCEYTDTPRERLSELLGGAFGDGLCLNGNHWPKIFGVVKHIHKPTGHYYVAKSSHLVLRVRHMKAVLNLNQHDSPTFQELWNNRKSDDEFTWEILRTEDMDEAVRYMDQWVLEDPVLCTNDKKFFRGVSNIGVYVITHERTGHYYVGSSKEMTRRYGYHMWALRNNRHKNDKFQSVHDEHGDHWEVTYTPLDCREEAYDLEQKYIDESQDNPLYLNKAKDARSTVSSIDMGPEAQARIMTARERSREWLATPVNKAKTIIRNIMSATPVSIEGQIYLSKATALPAVFEGVGGWHVLNRRLDDPEDTACFYVPKDDPEYIRLRDEYCKDLMEKAEAEMLKEEKEVA